MERRIRLHFVIGVGLLLVACAGSVAAADADTQASEVTVETDDQLLLAQEQTNQTEGNETQTTQAQTNQSAGNETADSLPVEPPTRAHPGYEYIKQEGDTDAKIELGKKLFFDPRISETGTISCNTCHNVMEGGDDGRPTSMGVHGQTGPVNAPTVWNSGFHHTQFWDGRADTLAEQAKGPIVANVEMGMPDHEASLDRIRSVDGYVQDYQEVYGDEADSDDPEDLITLNRTVDAIAAYERTLVTPNSSYDQYVRGDADALTDEQIEGMQTFKELGCQGCHNGPMFSGQWQDPESGNGVYQTNPTFPENEQCQGYVEEYGLMENPGRMGVTDDEADQYKYKVPTLRNVEHTAPYLHTGQVPTLEEAVRVMASCQLNQDPSDTEVQNVVAFLESLTGDYPEQDMPRLPEASGQSMMPANANGTLLASDAGGSGGAGGDTGGGGGGADAADGSSDGADDSSGPGGGFTPLTAIVGIAAAVAGVLVGYARWEN